MLEALNSQAKSMFFQSNAVALEVRARAADALAEFAPAGLNYVFFANSGSEANENALAHRLSTHRALADRRAGAWLPRPDGRGRCRDLGRKEKMVWISGHAVRRQFHPRETTPAQVADAISGDTAAVIIELVQGLAGAYDLDADFVQRIARLCAENGALLIVDEVQTGMGRCGQPFATDLYEIRPDILTSAKSIAGGFPCGAVIVGEEIAKSLGPGDLGSTFGGGPIACALVETVIDVIKKERLMDNVRELSQMIAEACPVGPVEAFRARGFCWACDAGEKPRRTKGIVSA